MRVRLEEVVPGVEPERALAWWSDFRDGRHDHRFVPAVTREVAREGDGRAEMVDRMRVLGLPIWSERTRAWREGDAVAFRGENNLATFAGAYRFAPDERGTRIVLEANVLLKPPLRRLESPARPVVLRILRADLRGHAREMRRELT